MERNIAAVIHCFEINHSLNLGVFSTNNDSFDRLLLPANSNQYHEYVIQFKVSILKKIFKIKSLYRFNHQIFIVLLPFRLKKMTWDVYCQVK